MGDIEADLSSSLPWRRSLRASQARRSAAARRRRLLLRGRAGVTLAVAGLTIAAAGALAQDPGGAGSGGAPTAERDADGDAPKSRSTIKAVQRALDLEADGVYGRKTRAAVRRFQRRNDLTVDGVIGPETLRALGISSGSGSSSGSEGENAGEPGTVSDEASATLQRIAQCESGGDPTAVSSDGQYRGKYQFNQSTWERIGGSGDPAAAPEAEQDRLAAKLLAEAGTSPWPVCGG